MHVSTIVAVDDLYKDGMLKKIRKKRNKNNNHLQTLDEVRKGWTKKGKSYETYLWIYNGEKQLIIVQEQGCHSRQ